MNANNTHSQYSPEEFKSFRKALIDKRETLTQSQASQLDAIKNSQGHHLADLEEMGDSADTDSLCEIMDISSSTIDLIDRALKKLGEGSYGFCETCAKPIHRARLKYLPFASLCIACQRKQEKEPRMDESPVPFEELP